MFALRKYASTAASLAVLAIAGSAHSTVTFSSSAYGVSADLSVLNLINATVGPLDPTGGVAPGAYTTSNTVLSASDTLGLSLANQHLSTGVLTATSSSGYPAHTSATAKAVVNNLATNLNLLLGPALLNLSANTITSQSSVNAFGLPTAYGSSDIEGLNLSGSALGGLNIVGGVYANAAPNTVLVNLGGLEVVLNQQIHGTNSIVTNAIAIEFQNFVLGTGVLNGDVIIGHSQAAFTGSPIATPEPATWAEMLLGFGVVGVFFRRRRPASASATA